MSETLRQAAAAAASMLQKLQVRALLECKPACVHGHTWLVMKIACEFYCCSHHKNAIKGTVGLHFPWETPSNEETLPSGVFTPRPHWSLHTTDLNPNGASRALAGAAHCRGEVGG